MIIASPWSRGGKVCSQVFDHTSTLQFLEEFLNKRYNKKIKETNISDWRRTVCGNLSAAFTKYDGNKDQLPFLSLDPFVESIYNAKFKDEPAGYKKYFEISMQAQNKIFGNKSAGSPFNIYAPGEYLSIEGEKKNQKIFEPVRAWHYAVTPGDLLADKWPIAAFKDAQYHLRVYGPNGFYREFTGNEKDPQVQIE